MNTSFDRERIRTAIEAAERRTSAEIVVSVAPLFWGDAQKAAERAFVRLGIGSTRARNGVLILVVPRRRQFVVIGDDGIHARVGQSLWDRLASLLSDHFRRGAFTEGVVRAVGALADELEPLFPRQPGDINELPDEVDVP
jgi:uncharacterized membrane protein